MGRDGDCTCITDIEARHRITEFADAIVTEIAEAVGIGCEEMMEYGFEQIIMRLVHVLATMRHLEREIDDPRVYEEVRVILTKYDRSSAAVINLIINEYKAKENPNARH